MNYYIDMILRGYKLIGDVSVNKVDKMMALKEAKRRYIKFRDSLDLKEIIQYYLMGLEARAFTDNRSGKVLTKNDSLMWIKNIGEYQYSFRRQPLRAMIPDTPEQSILRRLKQEGLI